MSEWTLHQPTFKGTQLTRNWVTSRESEHSPCNGQAKALHNAKGKLTNDPKVAPFLLPPLLITSLASFPANKLELPSH